MDSKTKRLVSDTVLFTVGNASTKLILFFLMPLYTTVLTTEDYGVSDTLNTLVELLLPLATLCISDAVFRFSVDEESDKKPLFSIGLFTTLRSIALMCAAAAVAYWCFHYTYTLYLLLMGVTYAFKQLFGCFLRGLGKTKAYTACGVAGTLSLVGLNLILLLGLKAGIGGYLVSIIVSNLIAALAMFICGRLYQHISFLPQSRSLKREMLAYSVAMVPNTVSWWINSTASRYVILFFHGAALTGLYAAAGKLPAMINLLSSIFQLSWQYSSAKEYKSLDKERFYSTIFRYYSMFISVSGSGIVLLSPLIARFTLRGEFASAQQYVPLLLVSSVLGCYSVYFGGIYSAAKRNRMLMISTLTGSFVNLAALFLLTPEWGAIGAATAGNVCYLAIVVFRVINTRRFVRVKFRLAAILSLAALLLQALYMTFAGGSTYLGSIIFFIIILAVNLADFLATSVIKRL